MLCIVIKAHCHYAECRYPKCRHAERHGAICMLGTFTFYKKNFLNRERDSLLIARAVLAIFDGNKISRVSLHCAFSSSQTVASS